MNKYFDVPDSLVLGRRPNERVPLAEQQRQRTEAEDILTRLVRQPGVVLADEVGMGKTFVALAAAYCVAVQSRKGPVVVMVPPNLVDKWEQDLDAFCALYLDDIVLVNRHRAQPRELRQAGALRYGVARHSVEFLKLLDDKPRERCHIVLLAQGAMSRGQTDIWVRLALIRETLRHGRRERLTKVRQHIHRFMGELLRAKGWERATWWPNDGGDLWHELLRNDPCKWKSIYNRWARTGLDDDPVPASVLKALSRKRIAIDLNQFAGALA
ncbi:MAG: SNF2-related protein, partial [Pirellulaceae bacterium]